MQTQLKDTLSFCTASSYYDFIIDQQESTAEAAYFLLKHRLSQALRVIYDTYATGLIDEFDDTIDDFFLYLYDDHHGSAGPPFAMLRSVRNKDAFFAWVVGTYRIFLLNKAKEAEKERTSRAVATMMGDNGDHSMNEEQMCLFLANAIACADQQLSSTKRFVLYRLLLSFLDHKKAIPQEVMAKALNLNATTYRVYTKRQKDWILKYSNRQENGKSLELDHKHQAMRDDLMAGFGHLYLTLTRYYSQALMELPNAEEVECLRKQYSREKASWVHERQAGYGFNETSNIGDLYDNMKAYLAR